MRLNFETEYFAISYHNIQPSFDFITVSHKKLKERRTKTTWKARELTSPFICLPFEWLLLSRKAAGNRPVRAPCFISFILSLNHLTRNMRRQNAPLLPGGDCRSLGCRGYLRALLDARILLGTTTRFDRHLPQAHLLVMSLIHLLYISTADLVSSNTSQNFSCYTY